VPLAGDGGLYLDICAGAPEFLVTPLLMGPVCILSVKLHLRYGRTDEERLFVRPSVRPSLRWSLTLSQGRFEETVRSWVRGGGRKRLKFDSPVCIIRRMRQIY